MNSPRATVVVVNYNGAHLLPPCLEGLRRQDTTPGFFETVVVDNASVDGSRELLARDFPEVRVIASPTNTGFAGGNNLALREVRTPYVALLNNDAVPAPDWLRRLLAPFEAPGAERLGVVTGKVVFAPRFLPLRLATAGFSPGPQDARARPAGARRRGGRPGRHREGALGEGVVRAGGQRRRPVPVDPAERDLPGPGAGRARGAAGVGQGHLPVGRRAGQAGDHRR